MRSYFTTVFTILLLLACSNSNAAVEDCTPTFIEDDVKYRVNAMPLFFKPKYNDVVGSYLRTYFERDRTKAERIIANTALYFPIFEQYLREQNMPMDLRMLPILESALNPHATSRSNAVGLWQFIQPTADGYGLANNRFVDERKDPHRSTQAALRYLKRLHERYGDWALALAAYNGGPTRVNTAIKRARSRDFWKVRKYLPKETQNYIPAFIAAAYLYNYYEHHGIAPASHSVEIQLHEYVKVFDEMSFQHISDITGVPMYDIEFLNPSYKQRIIPKSYSGNYLVLPAWACQSVKVHYPQVQTVKQTTIDPEFLNQPNYMRTTYTVRPGDNIFKVAEVFSCKPFNIKYWNNLKTDQIREGQELNVYMTTYRKKNRASTQTAIVPQKKKRPAIRPIPLLAIKSTTVDIFANKGFNEKGGSTNAFAFYTLKPNESLLDISSRHPHFSLSDLLALNSFDYDTNIMSGTRIKLPL
jgi:membrane-bound lytic murein transglycosylase D